MALLLNANDKCRIGIISTQYLPTPLMKDERLTPTAREVKWGVKVFDGSETIGFNANYNMFTITSNDLNVKNWIVPICSHFASTGDVRISPTNNTKMVWITDSIDKWNRSINDFKSFIKSEYDAGHPVTVWYQLATPTSESVTTTPIGTLDGECWVDIDTEIRPPYMETTYVTNADDSAEINEQSEENKEVIADEHQFSEGGTGSFE